MITFPHLWMTDPATGQLRCFRRRADKEPLTLAEALAKRMRSAVCHAVVSNVDIAGAQVRLHGYGEVSGDGVAALLTRLAKLNGDHVNAMSAAEDELLKIIEGWPNGAPADYLGAKEAARERFKGRYPNANPAMFDVF
ncbi:hypothetical protein VT84_09560 [Gemmata sp. SH-PL17]|uniref:hypothetical protein n=1 Tax=Gemmata sp. SH-PL17 TaxID=1630693 RepID=UPI00078DF252|nr:hypothetical protein [Gemmata sp. SH-PL17]AMV24631.1 hypothetical protein VT84_09560 [Gemmata sp. SH-PL17]